VNWLINSGADVLETDIEGRRAIDVAEDFEHKRIVQALIGFYPEGQKECERGGRLNALT